MARRDFSRFLGASQGYFGNRGVPNNKLLNDPRRRRPGYGVRPMTGGPGGLSPQAQLGWRDQLSPPPDVKSIFQQQLAGTPPPSMPPYAPQLNRQAPPPAPKQPGFFGRPGVGAGMTSAGAGMMQAASQPGATFLGSLGQGLMLGQKGYTEGKRYRDEQELLQSREAREQQRINLEATRVGLDVQEALRAGQSVESMLDLLEITDPEQRKIYTDMPKEAAADLLTAQLKNKGGYGSTSGPLQEQQYITQLRARLRGDPDNEALKQELADAERGLFPQPRAEARGFEAQWKLEQIEAQARAEDPNWTRDQPYPTGAQQMALSLGVITPGQRALDIETGKDIAAWTALGRANFYTKMETLEEVQALLASGQNITGRDWGTLHAIGGDKVLAVLNDDAAQALDLVRSIVFEGLRETLGAQFTEREGNRLVDAAYNMSLSEEMNARRIQRLAAQTMRTGVVKELQSQYFALHRGMQGFEQWAMDNSPEYKQMKLGMAEYGGQSNMAGAAISAEDYAGLSGVQLAEVVEDDVRDLNRVEAIAVAARLTREEQMDKEHPLLVALAQKIQGGR